MILRAILRHGSLATAAAVFLLLFSNTTSPMYPILGDDSAIFRVFGTAIARGAVPYVDIWDHKGPALFLIEALPQLIHEGRVSLFLMQVISLYVTLLLIDVLAKRFGGMGLRITTIAVVLALLSRFLEFGNLSEEFSLPFLFLAIVLLFHGDEFGGDVRGWLLACSGAAFAVVVMVRLNNALPIAGAFFAYFLIRVFRRQPFIRALLWSLGGFGAIMAAFAIGFAAVGALPEMINAAFLFNFRYSGEGFHGWSELISSGYVPTALIVLAVCLAGGTVALVARGRRDLLTLCVAVAATTAVAVLSNSTGYYHYLQLTLPAFVLGWVFLFRELRPRVVPILAVLTVVVAILIGTGNWFAVSRPALEDANARFRADAVTVLDAVPAAERGQIYGWNVSARFFLLSGELPPQRFFTLQDWWGKTDPAVPDEAIAYVKSDHPKWVVTPVGGTMDPRMRSILDTTYEVDVATNGLVLYERVGE